MLSVCDVVSERYRTTFSLQTKIDARSIIVRYLFCETRSEISDGQKTGYLVVNITAKTLYVPKQDAALQFCSLISLAKSKVHP